MESGRDMMWGGAKYNSTGVATMGIGTLADSLAAIKYMVYDKKLCTGRQLLDAVLADWKGHELLRQRIKNEVPCYGNGDPYVDELATWAAHLFADKVNSYVGPRGVHQAGLYSAAANILTGYFTHATPNGRLRGEPLSDAATPSNDAEKCGPTGVMQSVLALDSGRFGNGLQFNMKFHPTSLQGPDGNDKLRRLVEAFFDQGGQQVQYNVIDSEVLRKAQAATRGVPQSRGQGGRLLRFLRRALRGSPEPPHSAGGAVGVGAPPDDSRSVRPFARHSARRGLAPATEPCYTARRYPPETAGAAKAA